MANLIILSGPAGCGKTTWGNTFIKENPNTIMVSSDDVRAEILGNANMFIKEREHEIWDKVLDYCKEYSQKFENVILDSTAFTNKKRQYYYDNLHEFFGKITLVIFDVPLDVCIYRDSLRDRHVPEEAIKNQVNKFEEPSEEIIKTFTEIIRINK